MFKVFRTIKPAGHIGFVPMYRTPSTDDKIENVGFNGLVIVQEETDQEGDFRFVEFRERFSEGPRPGWMETRFIDTSPIPAEELYADQNEFAEDFFVRACVRMQLATASGGDASGHTVSAEFLVAVALLMSKLDTFGTRLSGTDSIGPFQFTGDEWQKFLDENPDIGLTASDRISHYQQIPCAAHALQKQANALRQKVLDKTPDDKDFMPSFLDVFVAWLTSPDAAAAINEAHGGADQNQPVRPLIEANVTDFDLVSKRCGLLIDVTDTTLSVDAFFEKVKNELNQKLKMAFNKMKQHAPEYLVKPTGSAPWQQAVHDEFDQWNVTPPFDEKSPQGIEKTVDYFRAIYPNWPGGEPTPAWCGAFAAFCVKKGGLGDTIPNVAEGARNWRNWGNISVPITADSFPKGAVVMTSKTKDNRQIGHVTFYDSHMDGKQKIECIGGNQGPSGRVTRTTIDISRVVAVRWQDTVTEVGEDDALVVAMTLYGEARNQDLEGRQAVASVILNRVAKAKAMYGLTAKDVCLKPWQFSCWNKNDPNRAIITNPDIRPTEKFQQCLEIARSALSGGLDDVTTGATHYYATYIPTPSWLVNNPNNPVKTAQFGVHLFFKNVDD